jgi:hypothetical protein
MAMNFKWSDGRLKPTVDPILLVPLLLIYGTIGMIFLGLATLGTSYRASIAQTVEARVIDIIPLCRFELPRVNPNKSAGVNYDLPCADTAGVAKLHGRGFILYSQTEQKMLLELQQSPQIVTSIVVNNSDVNSLRAQQKLPVRVPVLRNNETVELATATPLSQKFQNAFKSAGLAYAIVWLIFLLSYRRIRKSLDDGYDSTDR